jgi:hypothetical protein
MRVLEMIARLHRLWIVWIKSLLAFLMEMISRTFRHHNCSVIVSVAESMASPLSQLSATLRMTAGIFSAQTAEKPEKYENQLYMQIIFIINYFMFIMLIMNILISRQKSLNSCKIGLFICINENYFTLIHRKRPFLFLI